MFVRRNSPVRAGLFIGIDRVPGLPSLRDAARGARVMHQWALGQGMADGSRAKVITDEDGRSVTVDQIQDAVDVLLSGSGLDQLVVYFAGHGVYVQNEELWLLSNAPRRRQQAINVRGSVEMAKRSGVGHIVIVSDACRNPSGDLRLSGMQGQDLFANELPGPRSPLVDELYACRTGSVAQEVRDSPTPDGDYRSLYTAVLVEMLSGNVDSVLQDSGDQADPDLYIDPFVLGEELAREVARRLFDFDIDGEQQPEANVRSRNRWVSRIDGRRRLSRRGLRRSDDTVKLGLKARVRAEAATLTTLAVAGDVTELRRRLELARDWPEPLVATVLGRLALQARRTMPPFTPRVLPTGCGVKVRGTRIRDFFTPRMQNVRNGDDIVEIDPGDEFFASAVLTFTEGTGALVPVFAGHLTELTVFEGKLIDIGVSPSLDRITPERGLTADAVRATRAVLSATAGHSRVDLDVATTTMLLDQLRTTFADDPVISLHAATMLHDQQRDQHRIDELNRRVHRRFGAAIFDVDLLGSDNAETARDTAVVPFAPLLARNWFLLGARRARIDPALDDLGSNLLDSPWSLYNPAGVRRLRDLLSSGELR
jgi:caspase domain-containing protein